MKSCSHWGMFPCWEQGLPPMVEQPKSWVHVDIGTPYPIVNYTLAEALAPKNVREIIATLPVDRQEAIAQRAAELIANEDDLKLTIVKT